MFINNGKYVFDIDDVIGRGASGKDNLKLWDEKYTASDERSIFIGKERKKEKVKNEKNTKSLKGKIYNYFKK